MNVKRLLPFLLFCVAIFYQVGVTQSEISTQKIDKILTEYKQVLGLDELDFQEYSVLSQYTSAHNNVTHVILNQMHEAVPILNAVINLNIDPATKLLHFGNRFKEIGTEKSRSLLTMIDPADAINSAARHLGITQNGNPVELKKLSDISYTFKRMDFTLEDISVKLYYHEIENGKLVLVWNVELRLKDSYDFWAINIDAVSGEFIDKYNYTLYCSFEDHSFSNFSNCTEDEYEAPLSISISPIPNVESTQYLVYPLPLESPLHGVQQVVVDPADTIASPFGWHDTNGIPGADYTITRGNNVHAFQDIDGNEISADDEPDGGPSLNFNFVHQVDAEPSTNMNALITNLFYVNNYMHDFSYFFGFNEQAGNFQENNYSKGGNGNDYVIAQGLARETDEDGQVITNNATFSASNDGSNGSMNMFVWNLNSAGIRIKISFPTEAEKSLESSIANFGPVIGSVPLTGTVIITNDGVSTPTDACQSISNQNELTGNIALIDRGICEFGTKVLNAENSGAIAALICNVAGVNGGTGDELLGGGMGAGEDGASVSIPSLFLKKSDCELMKMIINGGTEVQVTLQFVDDNEGPSQLSGSFDNGIIAHEYGHGISIRLTGGPQLSSCLSNDEQMGEGWSDFFTLVTTHKEGDKGEDPRGIGNYVRKGDIDGRGFRRFPYSTDMSVYPLSYNDIRGTTTPHRVGEVWAACLWEMYWKFIDLYGFDPNWKNTEAGNYKAVQLVFDGMKFQPCRPGFIDGRDAILAADAALFDGMHQCLIWESFAKRGVGYLANQGSSLNRNDNEENFDPLPSCIPTIKISKEATALIEAGDDINVTISVANHKKNDLANLIVTDIIPTGTFFKAQNSDFPHTVVDGEMIIFEIGTLNSLQEVTIDYVLGSDETFGSTSILFDDFETNSLSLIQFPLQIDNYEWQIVNYNANSGSNAWFIPNDTTNLDQGLVTAQAISVNADAPVLKFSHLYETEFGFDGGFLEVSIDDGEFWTPIEKHKFLRNPYNSTIDFFTFAIPDLQGFTGNSNGWIESFVDLSDYKEQDIFIRFRFGCDSGTVPSGENKGWYIDDFEMIDLRFYDGSSACISSDEGLEACDDASTLITALQTTPTIEITDDLTADISIYPNPTGTNLYVELNSPIRENGNLTLYSLDGRPLIKQSIAINPGINNYQLMLHDLPASIYILTLQSNTTLYSQKIMKRDN